METNSVYIIVFIWIKVTSDNFFWTISQKQSFGHYTIITARTLVEITPFFMERKRWRYTEIHCLHFKWSFYDRLLISISTRESPFPFFWRKPWEWKACHKGFRTPANSVNLSYAMVPFYFLQYRVLLTVSCLWVHISTLPV